MNLYLFPALPNNINGYGIAVASDYKKLSPKPEDIVIWYTSQSAPADYKIIKRPSRMAFSRLVNVVQNKVNCEITKSDLRKISFAPESIDKVFSGDVIFYRALRSLFPEKKIFVRFHNCFGRIKDRIRLIDEPVNVKFEIQARAFYKLEREIFKDKNVQKIFISKEDRDYYTSNFGIESDSEVWGFAPDMEKTIKARKDTPKTKLVHFGGIQSHKIDGLKWFVNDVFFPLRKIHPQVEFHLWGRGSEIFDDNTNGIYGHGFYEGDDLPLVSEGLYVNPDIIGGGVKIKLLSYFEGGASFLSTPFGYEGYSKGLIDNHYCFDFLEDYFKTMQKR